MAPDAHANLSLESVLTVAASASAYRGMARGAASCGLSIISSYACGVGAVLALDAHIEVTMRVAKGRCSEVDYLSRLPTVTDPYLLECARLAYSSLGVPYPDHLEAKIYSDVPPKSGLKTSSAVAAAFIDTALRAAGLRPRAAQVVAAATAASRRTRITQAGSVDDTWCSVLGGVVVAGSGCETPMLRWAAPEDCEIVILVRENFGTHVHRLDRRALLAPHARKFNSLVARLVTSRDIFEVMTEAAFLMARAFGYGEELLEAALSAGALGVSLSGKGPAIGAVTRVGQSVRVLDAWRGYGGRIIRTRPSGVGLRTMADETWATEVV